MKITAENDTQSHTEPSQTQAMTTFLVRFGDHDSLPSFDEDDWTTPKSEFFERNEKEDGEERLVWFLSRRWKNYYDILIDINLII